VSQSNPSKRKKLGRNGAVALICGVVFLGMVGAAFAAIPFYRAFCQVTGYGGTVRKAEAKPDKVLKRTLLIRFDTNVRGLPWDFKPEQTDQTVKIGATQVAMFKVTNHADHPITARAVFNVAPEQAVAAGATVEMPVLYFVDPKYDSDFETTNGQVITLSYTFFPATDVKAPANATE
jgi:cytochrome c oxidase assembly protein subunit 11